MDTMIAEKSKPVAAAVRKSNGAQRRGKLGKKIWANRAAYLMLLPCVVSLLIFNYVPMAGLQIAFRNYSIARPMSEAPWVGFQWFEQFFQSNQFWPVVNNTLLISFLTLIIGYPLPILLAVFLSELRNKPLQRSMQTITYMPYFVSAVIAVSLVQSILSPAGGVVNELIKAFGGEPIIFLQESSWFRPIYFALAIWRYTGYDSIVFFGAISGIDQELYEAALIDGASRMQRIWHITLKCIMPTAAIMLILKVGKILNLCWQEILLMQNDLNLSVSEVIQTFVYKRGVLQADYSFATAVGLCTSLFSLVMVLLTNYAANKLSDHEVSMF